MFQQIIFQIVNNFDIECKNSNDVKCITSQVLVPDRKLKFVLTVRENKTTPNA